MMFRNAVTLNTVIAEGLKISVLMLKECTVRLEGIRSNGIMLQDLRRCKIVGGLVLVRFPYSVNFYIAS